MLLVRSCHVFPCSFGEPTIFERHKFPAPIYFVSLRPPPPPTHHPRRTLATSSSHLLVARCVLVQAFSPSRRSLLPVHSTVVVVCLCCVHPTHPFIIMSAEPSSPPSRTIAVPFPAEALQRRGAPLFAWGRGDELTVCTGVPTRKCAASLSPSSSCSISSSSALSSVAVTVHWSGRLPETYALVCEASARFEEVRVQAGGPPMLRRSHLLEASRHYRALLRAHANSLQQALRTGVDRVCVFKREEEEEDGGGGGGGVCASTFAWRPVGCYLRCVLTAAVFSTRTETPSKHTPFHPMSKRHNRAVLESLSGMHRIRERERACVSV
jgi:hypothetical protein